MDMKTIVEQLAALGVADDADVSFTFSDFAEVMHYTGEYVETTLNETDFLYTICDVIKSAAFEDNYIIEEMDDNCLLPEWDEDEYEDGQEWQDHREDTIPEVLQEQWFEYGWVDSSLTQYDHKRGRCDVSCEFSIPFSKVREHQDDHWMSCEVSVDIPGGGQMEYEI
jgi:hypothetical protein